MEIPSLIKDLAVMMLTAGIITVIFKRIKQPLILGYILAGFLLSPYFPWFTNIMDTESVETWSEIGIIFLMFHLGLEFNIKKLFSVGSTAIITSLVETVGMIFFGFIGGELLGFSGMDSLILGAMLVMSSTTIIIKVFDELKIKEKYTELVFGVLVIEDIVGIFMMVIMSTIASAKDVSGFDVVIKLLIMVLYLIIWLLLGIYILPTIMEKTIKFMTDEMLIVTSVGICFGMVLLADYLGFSSALGAFLSGSLLAGTIHAGRIEHLTKGIKDLFGAVFFISVGMMANPSMIAKYWLEIVVIVIITIVGKLLFNSIGMLMSGQNLKTSIEAGFSLAQIGEFAFIIANLGYALGLIDEFLYPIVVAVSVITTFTTPFLIKYSPKFVSLMEKVLPKKLLEKLNRYTESEVKRNDKDSDWMRFLKDYFLKFLLYGGLMFTASFAISSFGETLIAGTGLKYQKLFLLIVIYSIMALFTRPMLNRYDNRFTALWVDNNRFYRIPLIVLNAIKMGAIVAIAMIPLRNFYGIRTIWLALLLGLLIIFISYNTRFASWHLKIETRFLKNFNERSLKEASEKIENDKWIDRTLHIISFKAKDIDGFNGKTLKELDWGKKYNVYVVKIKSGEERTLLPKINTKILTGDKVYMVGEKLALENFYKLTGVEKTREIRTIKEFMDREYFDKTHELSMVMIKLNGKESYVGKSMKQANFLREYSSIIVGIQRNGLPITLPDPNMILEKDDIILVMGSYLDCSNLAINHEE